MKIYANHSGFIFLLGRPPLPSRAKSAYEILSPSLRVVLASGSARFSIREYFVFWCSKPLRPGEWHYGNRGNTPHTNRHFNILVHHFRPPIWRSALRGLTRLPPSRLAHPLVENSRMTLNIREQTRLSVPRHSQFSIFPPTYRVRLSNKPTIFLATAFASASFWPGYLLLCLALWKCYHDASLTACFTGMY